ncbi:hypothetical protein [Alteromonas aestuariivivens]|nr:hypothetical protein [Alteromonas aestuariivivens]
MTTHPFPAARNWISKAGVAGVLFFTFKGILWLLIPYVAGQIAGIPL